MTPRLSLYVFLALFGLSVCKPQSIPGPTEDQPEKETTSTWVSVGLGPGTMFTTSVISGRASISHQRGPHVYTLRVSRIDETIKGSLVDSDGPTPAERETEIALLYGRGKAEAAHAAFSVGIGVISILKRGSLLNKPMNSNEYEAVRSVSVGIALDGQLFFPIPRFVGLGLSVSGNLNPSRSFGGVMLTVSLGDI